MPTKPYVILQKRTYGKKGHIYSQWRITIPQTVIDKLSWNANDEIDLVIENDEIVCKNRANYSNELIEK